MVGERLEGLHDRDDEVLDLPAVTSDESDERVRLAGAAGKWVRNAEDIGNGVACVWVAEVQRTGSAAFRKVDQGECADADAAQHCVGRWRSWMVRRDVRDGVCVCGIGHLDWRSLSGIDIVLKSELHVGWLDFIFLGFVFLLLRFSALGVLLLDLLVISGANSALGNHRLRRAQDGIAVTALAVGFWASRRTAWESPAQILRNSQPAVVAIVDISVRSDTPEPNLPTFLRARDGVEIRAVCAIGSRRGRLGRCDLRGESRLLRGVGGSRLGLLVARRCRGVLGGLIGRGAGRRAACWAGGALHLGADD